MTRLDDFLGPLDVGVWEVIVPKQSVTEPLDPGWKKSALNVPSPGTIASYRKGQYHVHEQAAEWHVHLDNHDPAIHPWLHLIDDAPLLLMIGDTFVTLIAGTREKTGDQEKILEGQKRAWQEQCFAGILLIITGLFIILNPWLAFKGTALLMIPLAIISIGFYTLWKGIGIKPFRIRSRHFIFYGICLIIAGIIAFYLPLDLWVVCILGILTLWMLSSALVLIGRARKGRSAIPEGFASRIIIAIISLIIAALTFLNPRGIVELLMVIVGAVALLLGLMLYLNGFRLRQRMKGF